MAMAEKLRGRRAQIMAAQPWVERDIEAGRATPRWIKDLAALGDRDRPPPGTQTWRRPGDTVVTGFVDPPRTRSAGATVRP